jgi:hypothetical protein
MYWNNQYNTYEIGSSSTGATLTAAYTGNTSTIDIKGYKLVTVYIDYIPAVDTSDAYIQLEAGPDSATLFPKTALLDLDTTGESSTRSHIFKFEAVTAGVSVKRRLLVDTADLKLRISAKEVTSGAYGTIKIIVCRHEQFD